MTTRDWFLEQLDDDGRERTLPKWAQERMNSLRGRAKRYLRHLAQVRDLVDEDRVWITEGSNGHFDDLARVLPNDTSITFRIDGGEVHVELAKFGPRTRLRITGHATWDPVTDQHPDIAMVPALGNVVEVAFVLPVPMTLTPQLALAGAIPAIETA